MLLRFPSILSGGIADPFDPEKSFPVLLLHLHNPIKLIILWRHQYNYVYKNIQICVLEGNCLI